MAGAHLQYADACRCGSHRVRLCRLKRSCEGLVGRALQPRRKSIHEHPGDPHPPPHAGRWGTVALRELATALMIRDVNVRYRQTLIGIAWAALRPEPTWNALSCRRG